MGIFSENNFCVSNILEMITTYEAEHDIAERITANTAIALNLSTEVVDPESFLAKANANPFQIDLFYLKSILVSVGWNANDDVFDRTELITAKDTPVDKMFNFMHNEKDIIGHITSTSILVDSQQLDSIDLNNIPEKFDIVVGSVLYKKWQDEQLQERMNKIIAEIKENKWFISMECLFRDFDYAMIMPDNTHKTIARNAETAFLTKHLRAYGGTGEFKGNRIGRLIRNFAFSGKGLVDNPANKRSLILDYSDISEELTSARENTMSDVTYTKEQYDALVAKITEVEKSLQAKEAELAVVSASNKTQGESIVKLETELACAQEVNKNKDESISKIQAENAELVKQLDTFVAEAKRLEVEKVKASRITKLSTKDIDAERAAALVEKFGSVSDEMFDTIVNSLPERNRKTQQTSTAAVLDEYELDVEPSYSVASVDPKEVDELRSKAASWVGSAFKSTKKKGE